MKKALFCFLYLYCLVGVSQGQTSIRIGYGNDSLFFTGCGGLTPPVFTEFTIRVYHSGYNSTDTFQVAAFFGDGTYQSFGFINQWGSPDQFVSSFTHGYLSLGMFDATYIVTGPDGNADTLFHPAEVILSNSCSAIQSFIYVDKNSDCVYNAGDSVVTNVPTWLYNGVSVMTYLIPGSGHHVDVPSGVNYTALIDTAEIRQLGYTLACPASGMINFTPGVSYSLSFALSCNNNYDLAVLTSAERFKIGNSTLVYSMISDVSCVPVSGTCTLNLDPTLNFAVSMIPPASGSGSTYIWNFANLASVGMASASFNNMMYLNLAPGVQTGDTVCYSFTVSPQSGDIDTSNNTIRRCFVVRSAFDPNFKDVFPPGDGPAGLIAAGTKLTYTLGFQNTGNDTATHVWILDTLDADLDINTLRILGATHPMEFYILPGRVLKFDFPRIALPDSGTNQMASHGFVVYEVSPLSGLSPGTEFSNQAGIYFDFNPPVLTNWTLNTILSPQGIPEEVTEEFALYPNPATGLVRVVLRHAGLAVVTLLNLTGQIVYESANSEGSLELDVQKLPRGLYFIRVVSDNGSHVEKLILQ